MYVNRGHILHVHVHVRVKHNNNPLELPQTKTRTCTNYNIESIEDNSNIYQPLKHEFPIQVDSCTCVYNYTCTCTYTMYSVQVPYIPVVASVVMQPQALH